MNQKGQAMIEALIVGALGLLSLYFIADCGIRIIKQTLQDEIAEENYICQMTAQKSCAHAYKK
ncbi:MAG: hypothetical protein AABY53_00420 [Bdellovibrionota bacterium]